MDDGLLGHSGIKWQGDVGVVQYGGGDQTMVVFFYLKPVPNPALSSEAGRPVFEDKVFVRIHPPGERLNIIERQATDADRKRFPLQWAQYKENAPQVSTGTPIDMLFPANPAISAALKASGVHTVEQCANLSAHAIETIGMGAQAWVNDATRYMEVANKGVKASQLKAIVEKKDLEINSLKNKMELLENELAGLRETTSQAVTMADVQQMMANQGGRAGQRPQFAPGKQQNPNFDAQAAQINATHATRDIAKAKAAPKAKASPPKRERARIS
jgi:hypothetical protein